MQIIDADPTRMIDLPGVGPCPRPVDIDESVTGFRTLKSLRIYRFQPAVTIKGESEGDEVYVLPLDGAVDLAISGAHPLAASLSAAGERALYMPPGHAYRLTPSAETLVAYARAVARGRVATHVVSAFKGAEAEALSFVLSELGDGEDLSTDSAIERLIHVIGGTVLIGGQRVVAPQTVALARGEQGAARAVGRASVLMVSA